VDLKFYVLGPPYVTWNDSILDIPRRQVRCLLYHLATYPSAIPQERLHYLLWENNSEATCRKNLSKLFTHVRKILPDRTALIVKNSLVMLDHENLWCDAIEFKNLIKVSKEKNQHLAFRRAAKLYRGPYLEGVRLPGGREFEYIVEHERFSFERNYLSLLYKLIVLENHRQEYESAIEYAYQYLAVDNLCEEVHRELIGLFGLSGKRERAFEQYNICENLLARELQTKTSKKTQAMLQRVLSEEPLKSDDSLTKKIPDIRPVKNDPTFLRLGDLSYLDSLVNSRGENAPWGIVLLHGELGIGKTTLLTKYLDTFKKGNHCLYAKCNAGLSSIKFWPIQQICFSAGKSTQQVWMEKNKYSAKTEQRLANLLLNPDNLEIYSHILAEEYYFPMLVETIFLLADAAGGLILCIEDLEWADRDTLDLILYLSDHLRQKKILILGSYCCENNECLHKFIRKIQLLDNYLGTMELSGIDLETTLSVIKYWLGDCEGIQGVAVKLHQMCAGNPLFLTELLRWVVASNLSILDVVENRSDSLPELISNVIGFRLSLMERTERKVLNAIAVKGYFSDLAQIVDLTELSIQQVLDALDELVNYHFLEIHSTTYHFKHEIVRQFVLDSMSPVLKQFLESEYLVKQ